MRIDCGYCGRVDGVWAATEQGSLPPTLEAGWQRVACRNKECKAEGDVYLDPECAWCGGHDMWRTPNRSMDTNIRRWACRSCLNVTTVTRVVVLQQSVVKPHDVPYTPSGSKDMGLAPCGSRWEDPSQYRRYMRRLSCDGSGHPPKYEDWYGTWNSLTMTWDMHPDYKREDHHRELEIRKEEPRGQAVQR